MPPFYTYISAGSQPFSFGNALQFDGVNDFISFPTYTIGYEKSFSFWINLKSGSELINQYIFGESGDYYSWLFIGDSGSNEPILNARWTVSTTSAYSVNLTSLFGIGWSDLINNWNFITYSVDNSGNITFGINGNYATNSIASASFTNGINQTMYHSVSNPQKKPFCILDELCFFNQYISDSDFTSIYNNGNYIDVNSLGYNLHSIYRFNETSGATAADSSVNGNNATLNNFDTSTCWVAH